MGEAAKKICLASLQIQSNQVWIGDAAEGRTKLELDLKLGISNTYSAQSRGKYNHSIHQAEKNLINGSSTTQFDLKVAKQKENSKRLKRMMSNRVSSEKYRKKKMMYIEHLENQFRTLQQQISNIRYQIQKTKNVHQSLLIEQHEVKLQIAAFEKDRIIKEVEIERNIAEGNRLRKLQMNQLKATEDAKRNSDCGLHAINEELDLNL